MPLDVGINFRSTSGYVTDPAGTTYCLGDAYPVTRGGATFGWEDSPINVRDRNSALDARLAGVNYTAAQRFRVDLPAAGDYTVHFAGGDPAGSNYSGNWQFRDDTTTLFTLTASAAGVWVDASNAALTSANWPGGEAGRAATFASAIFRLFNASAVNFGVGHLRLVQAAAATRAQRAYRWRDDDGSESAATWKAAENTDASAVKQTNVRLRVQVDVSGDAPSEGVKLQHRKVGDTLWKDVHK